LCWQDQIQQTLKRLNRTAQGPRLVVLGVGHELRGDDTVGILLARKMRQQIPINERLLLIEAGPVPENFCGPLRRFSPDLVIVIDAAQMGLAPGSIRWLDWKDVSRGGVSTHATSLLVLCDYLVSELGCEMALLGIEPAEMSLDAPLSPPVTQAFQEVSSFMIDLLLDFSKAAPDFLANRRLLSEVTSSGGGWSSKYILNDEEVNPL
jgi:hydrogenase 3 maturation protease